MNSNVCYLNEKHYWIIIVTMAIIQDNGLSGCEEEGKTYIL